MVDNVLNWAYSTVATAPSPASSGTSLIVAAGQGALFPTPPFNATVQAANLQGLASDSEIVRVTGISTDTFTIVRNTSTEPDNQARSIVVGDQIFAGQTAGLFQQLTTQPGVILATKQYAPVSLASYIAAATTITALDTTNLTLSLIVPSNGIVDVFTQFFALLSQTTTQTNLFVALLNHTGGALVGNAIQATSTEGVSSTLVSSLALTFHLTGLTPGALQLDFAAGRTNATGCASTIYAQANSSLTVASDSVGPIMLQAKASV